MSYRINNAQPLGYVLESPKPIPPKVAPTATRMSVTKPTAAEASICLQKGGAWNKLTGKCAMPMANTTTGIDPAVAAAQAQCLGNGGTWDGTNWTCAFPGTAQPDCAQQGGAYDPVTGLCTYGAILPQGVQPGMQQQQPAKQGWWASLSDGQRYAIIGGAAVGVLAIGTGIVLLARKPKAVANKRKSKVRAAKATRARERMFRRSSFPYVIWTPLRDDNGRLYWADVLYAHTTSEAKRIIDRTWRKYGVESFAEHMKSHRIVASTPLTHAIPNYWSPRGKYAVHVHDDRSGKFFALKADSQAMAEKIAQHYISMGGHSVRIVDQKALRSIKAARAFDDMTPNASGDVTLKFPHGFMTEHIADSVRVIGCKQLVRPHKHSTRGSEVTFTRSQYTEWRALLNDSVRDDQFDPEWRIEMARVLGVVKPQAKPNARNAHYLVQIAWRNEWTNLSSFANVSAAKAVANLVHQEDGAAVRVVNKKTGKVLLLQHKAAISREEWKQGW